MQESKRDLFAHDETAWDRARFGSRNFADRFSLLEVLGGAESIHLL
jgi:hypothetical protein